MRSPIGPGWGRGGGGFSGSRNIVLLLFILIIFSEWTTGML